MKPSRDERLLSQIMLIIMSFIRIIIMTSVVHMSTTLFDGFDGSQLGHFIKNVRGLKFDGFDGFEGSHRKSLTALEVPTKIIYNC